MENNDEGEGKNQQDDVLTDPDSELEEEAYHSEN